ncbi:MAG: hypothetical protein ABIG39_04790 [Candidatus Micrarchaeota archaeon]
MMFHARKRAMTNREWLDFSMRAHYRTRILPNKIMESNMGNSLTRKALRTGLAMLAVSRSSVIAMERSVKSLMISFGGRRIAGEFKADTMPLFRKGTLWESGERSFRPAFAF